MKCGIVGLPNVGKSTIFNALLQQSVAESANYPFCTIEPNIGSAMVQDDRLDKVAKCAGSAEKIYPLVNIVDIAGIVRGASNGTGLGNQFLAHIREVDAIIQVVRCFESEEIIHVDNIVNPISDIDTINTELMLADLATIDKIKQKIEKMKKNGQIEKNDEILLDKIHAGINNGKLAINIGLSEKELLEAKKFNLLTTKPMIYLCNVAENEASSGNRMTQDVINFANKSGSECLIISAALEAQLIDIAEEEKSDYLSMLGVQKSGLIQLACILYDILGLMTFFTAGPKETRGWTIKKNTKSVDAAGNIHTDISRGFIFAETISYDDYINYNGEVGAKNAGKMRLEGKDYIMQDGDVVHFRFNV